MNLPEGQAVGQYTVQKRVGSGGMAVVYEAQHNKLGRRVALKMMHDAFQHDDDLLARFSREAQIVSKLEHPHIVPLYDFDEHEGIPYLIMKFIDGQTLKWHMRKAALPLEEVVRIGQAVAQALTYAHTHGVLHRDIKPGNVILADDGTVYLTDFGLARVLAQGESSLSAGMIVGTPHYIAPEQASGEQAVGAAADVYSLGVMLYEMLVGRVPFAAEMTHAILHDHIYTPPPLPSELNPEIPVQVEQVLLRALEKDPAARYPTPNALMDALTNALQSSGLRHLSPERSVVAQRVAAQRPKHKPANNNATPIPSKPEVTGTIEAELDFAKVMSDVKQAMRASLKPGFYNAIEQAKGVIMGATSAVERPYTPPTDEELETRLRKRVNKRLNARRSWYAHLGVYLFLNTLFHVGARIGLETGSTAVIQDFVTQTGLTVPQATALLNNASTDFPVAFAQHAELILETRIALTAINQPWMLVFSLFWLGGLLAHRVAVGNLSARVEDKRQKRLFSRLEAEYGEGWEHRITESQYALVDRQNRKRFEDIKGFWSHFVMFVTGNLAFAAIWNLVTPILLITTDYLRGIGETEAALELAQVADVPMFFGITVVWAMGLLIHMVMTVHGRNSDLEKELRRERQLESRRRTPRPEKRKAAPTPEPIHTLNDESPQPIRFTADGELTNSTVDAWEKRKN